MATTEHFNIKSYCQRRKEAQNV